ncbi:MAG: UDP-glucose/GDP-mannose dehydrogenase family protein [Halobacteriota archaeon]|jgi:nucleotide sugar dehydrogenase
MTAHENAVQRISIVGTGYVGLSTAVCFASRGYDVIASTRSEDKVHSINAKRAPFHEPGLDEAVRTSIESGHLRAEISRSEAVRQTEVTFLTVGTPERADGTIDLRYVISASEDIGRALKRKNAYHLVVVKSTVTPGTVRGPVKVALEEASGLVAGSDFGLCTNPEFLRQGSAIRDTLHPDRVIIGEYDTRSGQQLANLFEGFYDPAIPILTMSLESAEMVKYASNTFLAMKISYANEMARICEGVPGVDVSKVMAGVGLDERINPRFLNAGAGFGGSCLPKDTKALCKFAEEQGYSAPLLRATLAVNKAQAFHVAQLALSTLGEPRDKKVALLGLAFKPDTDDLREAQSLTVARTLLKAGAHVSAFDPVVKQVSLPGFEELDYPPSTSACLAGAHCCIILTEWEQFKRLTPDDFIQFMATPAVVDARRIFDPHEFGNRLTFLAVGVGRELDVCRTSVRDNEE